MNLPHWWPLEGVPCAAMQSAKGIAALLQIG